MPPIARLRRRPNRLKKWCRVQLRRGLRENASPLRTSAGLALGAFIGIVPSFFVGSPLSFFLAGRLGLNRAAAVVGTLFTNPLTAPFFYSISTQLGLQMLGTQEGSTAGTAPSMIRHYGAAFLVGNATFALAFALAAGLAAYVYFFFRGATGTPGRSLRAPDPWVRSNPEGEIGLRRRRQAVRAPLAPGEAFTQRVGGSSPFG